MDEEAVAHAYKVIDAAAKALRELVEAHLLRVNPEDAKWNYLVLLDDGGGGSSISHSFELPDGGPDVEEVLIALTLAGQGAMENEGGWDPEKFSIQDFLEQIRREKEEAS